MEIASLFLAGFLLAFIGAVVIVAAILLAWVSKKLDGKRLPIEDIIFILCVIIIGSWMIYAGFGVMPISVDVIPQ